MLGATLHYKIHKLHLMAAHWPENGAFCPERDSHAILDANEFRSPEQFARLVQADEASMSRLRLLLYREGNAYLSQSLHNDEILRLAALLLAQGRLKAVICANVQAAAGSSSLEETRSVSQPSLDTGAKKPDRRVKTWIEIRLVDDEGKPVPNEAYRLVTPDGSNIEGSLDGDGWARHEGLDPGTCSVCFPNIDGRAWHAA